MRVGAADGHGEGIFECVPGLGLKSQPFHSLIECSSNTRRGLSCEAQQRTRPLLLPCA